MKKVFLTIYSLILIVVLSTSSLFITNPNNDIEYKNIYTSYVDVNPDTYLKYSDVSSLYIDGVSVSMLEAYIGNKAIMIETALDLHYFSHSLKYDNNLSHEVKTYLASLDYVMGRDIDYSIMKSRRFMPIGYYLNESTFLEFSGTFDGRGFEISGLYYESFKNFSYEVDDIEQVYNSYFSMFNTNKGTIKNLGLINPIIDLENEHLNLTGFSYLVGLNKGDVLNTYVVDNKTIDTGSGIRAVATRISEDLTKTAAGLVNNNMGTMKDVYFIGENVVNSSAINAILAEPIVYYNTGTLSYSVYDNSVYKESVVINNQVINIKVPVFGMGLTTNELKSNGIRDNVEYLSSNTWYYYQEDGYPKLWGLNEDDASNSLIINSVEDFYTFYKLLNLRTNYKGKSYNDLDYILTNHINLNDLSYDAIKTPSISFDGSLNGIDVNGARPQINNLSIKEGVNIGSNHYVGLFSVLTGTIDNIVLYDINIDLPLNGSYYGQTYLIGYVAGHLNNGTISNVSILGNTNLTNRKIGSYSIGGVAGIASGNISNVINDRLYKEVEEINIGNINVGDQAYSTINQIGNEFNLGGIVGSTTSGKLTIMNATNNASLTTISGNIFNSSTTTINNVNLGGIIGLSNNDSSISHDYGSIANKGLLTIPNITNTNDTLRVTANLGGIFGLSLGNGYEISSNYGKWTNVGSFMYDGFKYDINVAGVLNSNHDFDTEFVQVYNDNDLVINSSKTQVSSLINHFGLGSLTISQARSTGKLESKVALSLGVAIYVKNNNLLNLNFVDIQTDLVYKDLSISSDTSIAGVTLQENTNFRNVIYAGKMDIKISGNNNLFVSGLTKVLSSNRLMINSMNEGSMIVDLSISNTVNTKRNVYVAGLVNRNLSGDLHNKDSVTMPRATLGIINSINRSNIDVTNSLDANLLVGGITTLNGGNAGGSIQDSVNTGDIIVRSTVEVSKDDIGFGDQFTGGVVNKLRGGVFVGGVTAIVSDGYSRIYDTSNSGSILATSFGFARAGGILGSVLRQELTAAGINSNFYNNNSNDTINNALRQSILSNGINYGNISTVTSLIGEYTGTLSNSSGQRPGIYSSSGGVIGYGLSTMVRMINHGTISSTDVSGGIVGATSAYDQENEGSSSNIIVNINTAINYGDIRMIKKDRYGNISSTKSISEDVNLYNHNDSFISPNNITKKQPGAKRGIGGIFGRLQRATNQRMRSDMSGGSFDFVVNMNENVDLIGRLDQVSAYGNSISYFNFSNALYYSAKENDFTQTVFVGYYNNLNERSIIFDNSSDADINVTLIKSVTSISNWWSTTHTKNYEFSTANDNYNSIRVFEGFDGNYRVGTNSGNGQSVSNIKLEREFSSSFTKSRRVNAAASPVTIILTIPANGSYIFTYDETLNTNFSDSWGTPEVPVPHITENPQKDNSVTDYVYDENFVMRTNETLQKYIYFAERNLLSDRFYENRLNGMYVLSTSAGSTFGSVLPRNFIVSDLRRLNNIVSNNIDYTNVHSDNYLEEDTNYDDLLLEYKDLYQTKLNDKSDFLVNNQIVEFVDEGINQSNYYTTVTTIDTLSQAREGSTNILNLTIDTSLVSVASNHTYKFSILDGLIPENALIARKQRAGEDDKDFQEALLDFVNENPGVKVATGDLAPKLDFTKPNNSNSAYTTEQFVIYSEAAINDYRFVKKYISIYNLNVNVITSNINNPVITSIQTDNNNTININNQENIVVNINNGLLVNFSDASNKLKNGYNISRYTYLVYIDNGLEVVVNPEYYDILVTSKFNNVFSINLDFEDKLRLGKYKLKYKYFESDILKEVTINYSPNRNNSILNLIAISGTTFNNDVANIAFNYDLFTNHSIDPVIGTITSMPNYLDNRTYNLLFTSEFLATPFFDITKIESEKIETTDRYFIYEVKFSLEDGSTYNIVIEENRLEPNFYKEGNQLTSVSFNNTVRANTNASREAIETNFRLDYSFFGDALYNKDIFDITYSYNNDTATSIYLESNKDLEISFDNSINIKMLQSALPGTYTIDLILKRNNNRMPAGRLVIEKLKGTSAYLRDISFSEFIVGIDYPNIKALDDSSDLYNIISHKGSYEPNVYILGIDYDNADLAGISKFSIDGKVAGTTLNEYMPYNILNNLAIGSTIQRIVYNGNINNFTYTPSVNSSSTIENINQLQTDFTVDPITNNPVVDENSNIYIEYLVTSEDGLNKVLYYISVRDIIYSFTAIFDVKYKENNGYSNINTVSELNDSLILISMDNLKVSKNGIDLEDTNNVSDVPSNFPSFDNVDNIRSSNTMFYYINSNLNNYYYSFGNNYSGFYDFSVRLPKGYKYSIYLGPVGTNEPNVALPKINSLHSNLKDLEGYYYYINASPRTRTRSFTIVIEKDSTSSNDWGLNDNTNSWN